MIALKLVRLIESHSDELAKRLLARFERSVRTHDVLCNVPRHELERRAYEVYSHLTGWLLYETDREIEKTYTELGMRRASQGVPFGHFFWAIVTTREVLWEFLQEEGFAESPLDLRGGFDLLRLLEQFFDKALYYATVGYHRSQAATAERAAKSMAV
ncbi:MAG: hypothetical protein WCC59_12405 [Terriglobales bacterium]